MSSAPKSFMFLEGLRGLGALHVVVAHIFSLFFPVVGRMQTGPADSLAQILSESPFFFLIDGGSAVFGFFLISGFVLSHSYLRTDLPLARQVAKRTVRLYLPVLAALLLSVALLTVWPEMRQQMQPFNTSHWLTQIYDFTLSPGWALAQDILLNSMFLGYFGVSIFQSLDMSGLGLKVVGLSQSLDPPLWSLHIELWGSLLTIVVAKAYLHLPRLIFWPLFAAAFVMTAPGPLCLFLIGFLAYIGRDMLMKDRDTPIRSCLSLLLVALGVIVTTYTLLQPMLNVQVEKEVSAILILAGVLISPRLRRILSFRWQAWLGRLSFGLYLTHFPILFTVGIAIFLPVEARWGYMPATLAAGTFVVVLSLLVSILFERFVDQPSIRLSHLIGGRPLKRVPPPICSHS